MVGTTTRGPCLAPRLLFLNNMAFVMVDVTPIETSKNTSGLRPNKAASSKRIKSLPEVRMSAMLSGLTNRLVVFVFLVALTFFLPRLMPGDPLDILFPGDLARDLTPAEIAKLRHQMGLDGSLLAQFASYCKALFHGDLGFSCIHAAPVTQLLASSLPWTGLLMLLATPIFLLLGIGCGIEAGRQSHQLPDRIMTTIVTIIASLPPFVTAVLLLVLFGFGLSFFPVSGAEPLFPSDTMPKRLIDILYHAVLPATALAMHEVVRFYFLSRGEAIKLSVRPFISNARARGIGEGREFIHYFGRNLLPTLLARLSDTISTMVTSVLFVEIVFSYPGIGHLIYNAVLDRDFVLLQGSVLGLAAVVLLANWLLDNAVALLAERG